MAKNSFFFNMLRRPPNSIPVRERAVLGNVRDCDALRRGMFVGAGCWLRTHEAETESNGDTSALLMIEKPTARLIADHVECLRMRGDGNRVDIELRDARGQTYVVSLPTATAVELGLLIRGVAEQTPFFGDRESYDR
jgi:hypothetical protein